MGEENTRLRRKELQVYYNSIMKDESLFTDINSKNFDQDLYLKTVLHVSMLLNFLLSFFLLFIEYFYPPITAHSSFFLAKYLIILYIIKCKRL